MAAGSGRLEVISTPIGNIGDLAPRARAALESADLVLAEDTRHSGQLLAMLGIQRPLLSLHEHNEQQRVAELLGRIRAGAVLALICDAGTPLISDPGFALVQACAAAGLPITVLPGASALTAALAISGLPTDRFVFEGFLPTKGGERRQRLRLLAGEPRTLVFYEAPHRIAATLADCAAQFGADRRAVVARELTKLHETVYRDTLGGLCAACERDANFARGELTLLIAGDEPRDAGDEALLARALELLRGELPPARAAAIAAQLAGVSRERAYGLLVGKTAKPDRRSP